MLRLHLNKRAATEELLWYIVNIMLAIVFVVIPMVSLISQVMHSNIINDVVQLQGYSLALDSIFSYDFLKSILLPTRNVITINNNEINYVNYTTHYLLPSFYRLSRIYQSKLNVRFNRDLKQLKQHTFEKSSTFCINTNCDDLIPFFKNNLVSDNLRYNNYTCDYNLFFSCNKNSKDELRSVDKSPQVIFFPISSLSQLKFINVYQSIAKKQGINYAIKRYDGLAVVIPVQRIYTAYDLFKKTLRSLVQTDVVIITNYTFSPGSTISLSCKNTGDLDDSEIEWSITPFKGDTTVDVIQKQGRTIKYDTSADITSINVTLIINNKKKKTITLEAKTDDKVIYTNNVTRLNEIIQGQKKSMKKLLSLSLQSCNIDLSSSYLNNILLKKTGSQELDYYKGLYLQKIVNRLIDNYYNLNNYFIFFSNYTMKSQVVKMLFVDSNDKSDTLSKEIINFLNS